MMTPSQEMVMTLFTDETINKVKEEFKNNEELIPIESFDMTFRLVKSNINCINLELLMHMTVDSEGIQDISGIGQGELQTRVMFYKPIGYYTQIQSHLSNEVDVTVVKEFENDLDFLISAGKIPPRIIIHKLTLEENAILAAFSLEALLEAEKYKDSRFFANGLHCEIFMTFDNEYPQLFLDDRYGVSGPIAAYLLRDQNSIFPILKYEDYYEKLYSMDLLTAYKRL